MTFLEFEKMVSSEDTLFYIGDALENLIWQTTPIKDLHALEVSLVTEDEALGLPFKTVEANNRYVSLELDFCFISLSLILIRRYKIGVEMNSAYKFYRYGTLSPTD